MIIGSNHGSLGALIQKNHLGYVFESENPKELAKCISNALNSEFLYDQYAKSYQKSLDPQIFLQRYTELYHSLKS